jgi:hypothetical protein
MRVVFNLNENADHASFAFILRRITPRRRGLLFGERGRFLFSGLYLSRRPIAAAGPVRRHF